MMSVDTLKSFSTKKKCGLECVCVCERERERFEYV